MEEWAAYYDGAVQFLCVCVESLGVALMFDRMFGFQDAINAYIPGRPYMPHGYGQLGCSGFIVVDAKGNFISRQTAAYLQFGDQAFRHVESLLEPHLQVATTAAAAAAPVAPAPTAVEDMTESVPSTGIASMDHEHESCLDALHNLQENPTQVNLQKVLKELERHFAHEEALMVQSGFGGRPGDAFSALTSHTKDHKRILAMITSELTSCEGSS